MRVTSKGQVTIPLHIREKLGILPNSEVDFIEESGQIILRAEKQARRSRFSEAKGILGTKMSTDEILKLTRR